MIAAIYARKSTDQSDRAERGDHVPRAAILRRWAEITGVSVDWMLTGPEL